MLIISGKPVQCAVVMVLVVSGLYSEWCVAAGSPDSSLITWNKDRPGGGAGGLQAGSCHRPAW